MPRRIPRVVSSWLRTNGAGLWMVAVAYGLHGTTFMAGMPPSGWPAHLLETLAPRAVWGALWVLVALALAGIALCRPNTPHAVGLAISMSTLWSISWGVQSIVAGEARSAATAVGWGLVSVLIVWAMARGQAQEVRMEVSPGGGQ